MAFTHVGRQTHIKSGLCLLELLRLPNLLACHMSWILHFRSTVTCFDEMLVLFHQNCFSTRVTFRNIVAGALPLQGMMDLTGFGIARQTYSFLMMHSSIFSTLKKLFYSIFFLLGLNLFMFTIYLYKILAMRHPRKLVLAGCLSALTVMTALSASLGWVAPNLISRKWTHHITTLLFFVFGIWSLWEGFKEDGDLEELAEMEAKLDADFKSNKGESKKKSKANDDMKKQHRPFLMQFFSPIFIKAFSITFFGEWGDKSQIATIGLAADENPFGVVIGGVIAQALCTTAAVMGGKSLALQISEKMVELSSGVLFLLFGIMSLLSGPEGQL